MTFPFLFGVMFGDVGHGIMMLLFVAYMIYKEDDFMKVFLFPAPKLFTSSVPNIFLLFFREA